MDNLILIGMPSSGKSTVGALLSERLGYAFLDGDALIERAEGKKLSEIISERGAEGFLETESRVLCHLRTQKTVIAPGGSAVYSQEAMAHLKSLGIVVLLRIDAEEAARRIPDPAARGIVMRAGIEDLAALFAERDPLYRKYADITVDSMGKTAEETAEEVLRAVRRNYGL